MGKGKRAREARAGKREEMQKAAKKLIRRKKITKAITVIVTLAIVIGIAGFITFSIVSDTGYFLRNTIAMETKNYKVDNAMMTYYVKNIYHSTSDQFSTVIDSNKSLKSQEYLDGTWLDQFLDIAETQVTEMLLSAESAKKEGLEKLTDEHQKQVDNNIKSMKSDAKANDVSFDTYLARVYGKGIKEKDIRKAMELAMIANQYQEKYYEDNKDYTDEEYEEFYKEHRSNYDKVEYYSYTLASTNSDKDAATKESQDFANGLKDCKTPEEFKATLENRLTEYYTKLSTATDEETKKNEVQTNVESDMKAVEHTEAYPSGKMEDQNELTKWLFDEKTAVGDTKVIKSTENDKQYTAYMMVKTVYRDENVVSNIRQLYFEGKDETALAAAKAEAEKVLSEYEAGEKTEEAFTALVKKYSKDETTQQNGGLIENVYDDGSQADELIAWSGSADRKAGDVQLIETASGYYLTYYVEQKGITWKLMAQEDHINEDWTAHLEDAADDFKVTVNEDKMKSIDA